MKDYYVELRNGYCTVVKATNKIDAKQQVNDSFSRTERDYNGCDVMSVTEATDENRNWVTAMGSGVSVVIDD